MVSAMSSEEIADSSLGMENRICPGCKQSAVNENGGLVVAFGQSFFHVDCFKCAKCGNQVTADTNLLLLSDGSPICANCSYSCNVCHLPILDEAIMTGDDSYHAHCFKCKVCKNRIDELVFAKTSQGIYCMNCHSERMIKIRRHAQKKADREKAAGSSSSRSREQEVKGHHREHGAHSSHAESGNSSVRGKPSSKPSSHDGHSSSRPGSVRGNEDVRPPSKPRSGPYISDAFESNGHASGSTSAAIPLPAVQSPLQLDRPLQSLSPSQPVSVNAASPGLDNSLANRDITTPSYQTPPVFSPPSIDKANSSDSPPPYRRTSSSDKQNKMPTLGVHSERSGSPVQQRQSHDGGPFKVPSSQDRTEGRGLSPAPTRPEGLNVPTSRSAKRRSINPGLVLSNFGVTERPPTNVSPTMSPSSVNFHGQTITYQTPSAHGRDSPHLTPPSEQFSSRRSSHTGSLKSPIASSAFHSALTSPVPPEEKSDQLTGRSRSASASTFLPEREPDKVDLPSSSASTTERVPANSHTPQQESGRAINGTLPLVPGRASPSLGPNGNTLRMQRSFDDRHSAAGGFRLSSSPSLRARSRSASHSRSPSPAHRADVPHSIESGTDTEAEGESSEKSVDQNKGHTAPTSLPPKESAENIPRPQLDTDPDVSVLSQIESAEGSDDMSDSSPVERVSHATFIAPALPPIRFSMSGSDFSEFLTSVGGNPSLKSLDHMARLTEETEYDPRSDAMKMVGTQNMTPTSDITLYGTGNTSSRTHLSDEDNTVVWRTGDAPVSTFSENGHAHNSVHDSYLSRQSTQSSRCTSSDNHSHVHSADKSSSQVYLIDPHITLTEPGSSVSTLLRHDTLELAIRRLQEALVDAKERGAQQLKLERRFIEAILGAMELRRSEYVELQGKFNGIKRTSKHYMDDLKMAQTEYDRELKARRDAEAEVTRLRVLLSGQAARLTALSGDTRRQEVREQLSKELSDNLSGLEHNLSKLRVERDMALAEVEEISASKSSAGTTHSEPPGATLGRSLTMRLDSIKSQYQHELIPLTQKREILAREIAELKSIRDAFLEETTALNARNEELAQLSAQYARRMDSVPGMVEQKRDVSSPQRSFSSDRPRPPQPPILSHSLSSSTNGSSTNSDETAVETKLGRLHKPEEFPTPTTKGKFKWPGSKTKEHVAMVDGNGKGKGHLEHSFQQLSILRFTKCDHCGDKMWGSQLRCSGKWIEALKLHNEILILYLPSGCHISVHVRCVHHVQVTCIQSSTREETGVTPPLTSLFGRDLSEQVRVDSKGSHRQVPVIVEKCIDAVEALALDYEGIYRKSGGSGQSKTITHLFESGDYNAFDLRDSDRFNDICSVTSVLKSYFRSLPNPLLTYELHENFMSAVEIKDVPIKNKILLEQVNQLPDEHYYTLRVLMLHLYRVREHSESNLMTSRNLGVVFGPTLMRSRDPASEFSDMAGKALTVEWLVDNASFIFNQKHSSN